MTCFSKLNYHQKPPNLSYKTIKSPAKKHFCKNPNKICLTSAQAHKGLYLTCTASVFGLYGFININISSSISTSKTKILPLLSVLIFLQLILLFPRKSIITPEVFVIPREKNYPAICQVHPQYNTFPVKYNPVILLCLIVVGGGISRGCVFL